MYSKKTLAKIGVFSRKLSNARKNNSLINPLPRNIITNPNLVKKIKNFAEEKLNWSPIGFKIGATNKEISKILGANEPFYSYLFKEKTFKNNSKLTLSPKTMGIELEIAYKIGKEIFNTKIKKKEQLKKFISGIAPAIELVGYRQKLNEIKFVGQAVVDFGLNISFIKTKINSIKNILYFKSKTKITNLKTKKVYLGHTNKVMGNPINSLFWLIKELQKQNVSFNKNFWVTTGSTTQIVPVKKGDEFLGEVTKIGNVKVNF